MRHAIPSVSCVLDPERKSGDLQKATVRLHRYMDTDHRIHPGDMAAAVKEALVRSCTKLLKVNNTCKEHSFSRIHRSLAKVGSNILHTAITMREALVPMSYKLALSQVPDRSAEASRSPRAVG